MRYGKETISNVLPTVTALGHESVWILSVVLSRIVRMSPLLDPLVERSARGLALRMEICEPHDSFTPSKAIVDRMVDEALKGDLEVDGRKYGLVLDIGGYYKNVVTLAPSLHITKQEMNLALKLLDRLMQRVSV